MDSLKKTVRIAAGQGFWGDLLDAPVRQVEGGPIDYLMLDYLAEVTMSIMQKQRSRDPSAGYAKDFVPLMKQILPACVERDIRVTANAGGVNVTGCAEAVREVANELGLRGKVKIGIVTGDDIMPRIDELLAKGIELRNMDTGEPLSEVRDRIQSANAYLGAWPMVEALNRSARVVITGRATDTGLTLAPLIHEFGWREDDWNLWPRVRSRATSLNAARSAPAAIVSTIGATSPILRMSAFQSLKLWLMEDSS